MRRVDFDINILLLAFVSLAISTLTSGESLAQTPIDFQFKKAPLDDQSSENIQNPMGTKSSTNGSASGAILIPAGPFTMGTSDGDSDERPVHQVHLDSYYIDKTEVTVSAYTQCVREGKCQKPSTYHAQCNWGKSGRENHPINCITWEQAKQYCSATGKRLPTEAEWEKAARGPEAFKYPWGNEDPDCTRANMEGCGGSTSPVGSRPRGASPYGALDMSGNVWEWNADWYDSDAYSRHQKRNPTGPSTGSYRVIRGGHFSFNANYIRGAYRSFFGGSDELYYMGVRCVKSAGASSSASAPVRRTPSTTSTTGTTVKQESLHVPAGEFIMGTDDGDSDERPAHNVYLDGFYIDKTEITVSAYQKCLDSGRCTAPSTYNPLCNWGKPDRAHHPVNCVTWEQAQRYCASVNKRLPTEAEWEKAARGTSGRKYPWGDQAPDCDYSVMSGCGEHTAPVGSKPRGASPYGALDMAGNVWEWTADRYSSDTYRNNHTRNPRGPNTDDERVIRGGHFNFGESLIRSAYRSFFGGSDELYYMGFRCAKSE